MHVVHAMLLGVFFSSSSLTVGEDKNLYLLGLYPFSGAWSGGPAMNVSTKMGLEDVNAREDILPGYKLHVVVRDTKCNAGVGVNNMYDELYKPPTKIMVFGAACSPVSEATAIASHHWNVTQLSYLSGSPALSDKSTFPLFFRLNSPRQVVNPARIKLLLEFNWKRVATIHESAKLFSKTTDDLIPKLHENNITLISSEIYSDDPSQQVLNLKRHDARIIISDSYEDKAFKLLCEIYKAEMYGPKYVWIISGFYENFWWLKKGSSECSVEQITEVARGCFIAEPLYINQKQVKGIAGLTSNEWKKLFDERIKKQNVSSVIMDALPYDAVWVAALALNRTMQVLQDKGYKKGLEDFTYKDRNITEEIKESLFNVSFQGIKTYLRFDEFGDVSSPVKIARITDNGFKVAGYHDPELGEIEWVPENPIVWEGGSPPADSTTREEKRIFVQQTTYIIMSLIAALGILLSIAFFIFNFTYRKERIIKMSSPKMNNVILVGCMVAYITVFVQELSDEDVLIFCKIRTYTLMIGFSLAFGALFAKTWRVYAIFMNRTRKVVIKDEQLMLVVAAIVGIDVVIAVVREIADPLKADSRVVATIELDRGDLVITNLVWVCTSTYDIYFKGVIYAIKGLLLIFGAFLAMQTRKVKIPALNDSQYIGLCIYNVAVLSLLGVVLTFALSDQVDLSYIFTCSFIICGTTLTQLIIFIPKITKFKNQVGDDESRVHSVTTAPTVETATTDDGVQKLRAEIEKKDKLLAEAEERLKAFEKRSDT